MPDAVAIPVTASEYLTLLRPNRDWELSAHTLSNAVHAWAGPLLTGEVFLERVVRTDEMLREAEASGDFIAERVAYQPVPFTASHLMTRAAGEAPLSRFTSTSILLAAAIRAARTTS